MALDLSTLIQGLGALSQGIQQGGAQSLEAKQQVAAGQREREQLDALNQLRSLQAQGLQQELSPIGGGTVEEFTQQRGLSSEAVPENATLGQLSQMGQLFPLIEEASQDPLESELMRAKIDSEKALAEARRRKKNKPKDSQLGLFEDLLRRRDAAMGNLVRIRTSIMAPAEKRKALQEILDQIRSTEKAIRDLGFQIQPVTINVDDVATAEENSGLLDSLRGLNPFGGGGTQAPSPTTETQPQGETVELP